MMRNLLIVWTLASAAPAANSAEDAIPLLFIANRGQAPPAVRFMAKGSGVTAFFSPEEAVFRMGDASVRVQFAGGNPAVRVEGSGRLPGQANFLTGAKEGWRLGVPLYGGVVYRDLYPGIDMVYGSHGRSLKSEFIVAPGADPARIRMRYVGGEVRIEESGALAIAVDGRELREEAPSIYQYRGGERVAVDGRFVLAGDGVGFIINGYDADRPLIIDPVLSYSTLVGGAGSDAATALAVDATGAAYVAGFTASFDFPTANPAQNFDAGGNDVFVAKLNPAGNGLIYCTYLGGKSDDRAYGIAVDGSGAAYLTGSTTSSNFPLRGAIQTKLSGAKDAFVAKLNPAGNSLVFSTYLGGSGSDTGNGIAVDGSGNVYAAGDTTSSNFPASGFQNTNRGSQEAFVAKLNAAGSQLLYSTYLGGAGDDHGAAIAVDAGGSAYVTGSTYSSNFPVAGAWQGSLGGGQDAFASRLNAAGSALLFSTFLGGSGGALGYPESGQGIALDAQGNAYIGGVTSSPNFPLLNPLQSSLRGSTDAFVVKLNSSGVPSYSTFLGGTGADAANAIAVDASGNAFVVGQTFSSDLAVASAFQAMYGGDYDAFVAKVSAADALVLLSYLGGSGSETATAVALDPSANIYVAGWTLSANFPVLNGYQSANAGNYGAFVTKVLSGAAGALPVAVGVTPNAGSGSSQTFSFQFSDSAGANNLTTVSVLFNSSTAVVNACSVTYTRAANTLALLTDAGAAPAGTITPGSGSQQNSQCVLNGAGSSVSTSGNGLTLNLAISFQPAFAGSKNIYLQAVNPYGSSGWQTGGTWTVVALGPVSVTPSSGSGSNQTFSFVYSDPNGYAALSYVQVTVNNILAWPSGCSLTYYPGNNTLVLLNDAGTSWMGPVTLGQSGTLQNSQCLVNAAASSASGSGNNLTVNLALSFQAAFTGLKNIYMLAYDGSASGWQLKGSWTASPAVIMGPVSVTPNSGSGSNQTFSFVYSDPNGYAALSYVQVTVNNVLAWPSGCSLTYYPGNNTLVLLNDAGTTWMGPVTLGQSGTLQNTQCMVNAAASSASGSGNNLTVNLALSFQAAFTGLKNIYMLAYDGSASGWQLKGSWTALPAAIMGPVSVTPNSGSGGNQTFSFVYADPNGYAALSYVQVTVNNVLAWPSGCSLTYYPGNNTLVLLNDAGTTWMGPVTLGQSGTLQNSQCLVNAAASSASGSGNNLTVNLALSFQAAFTGLKNIYMLAYDGSASGWQLKGSWTIP